MNKLLAIFGFIDTQDFLRSVTRLNISYLLVPVSFIGAMTERYFGLDLLCTITLFMLLILELFTGLWAAKRRKDKISSLKLTRFGLKALVLFFLLMLFHVFSHYYASGASATIYSGIHSFLVMYIIGIYSVSVLENANSIAGGDSDITAILKKLKEKLIK